MPLGVVCKGFEDKVRSQYHCCGKLNSKQSTCLVYPCESLVDAANTYHYFFFAVVVLQKFIRPSRAVFVCRIFPAFTSDWLDGH